MSSSSLDYLYKTPFSNQVTFEAVGLGSHSILRGPSGARKPGDGFIAAFLLHSGQCQFQDRGLPTLPVARQLLR